MKQSVISSTSPGDFNVFLTTKLRPTLWTGKPSISNLWCENNTYSLNKHGKNFLINNTGGLKNFSVTSLGLHADWTPRFNELILLNPEINDPWMNGRSTCPLRSVVTVVRARNSPQTRKFRIIPAN